MRLAPFRRGTAVCLLLSAASLCAQASGVAPLPDSLADTGLYADASMTAVRAGILSFSPQYPLWSDGATKRRWLYLPPGRSIDAAQPNAWEFPVGTRLWKEFSFGHRVETRYIERLDDGSWRFATYVWNAAGSEARLAPALGIAALPVTAAPGGRYAIPSETDCRACHEGAPSPVLGFSALQLSPDRDPLAPHAELPGGDEVDLTTLVAGDVLRNLPQALIDTPPRIAAASPVTRAVLGYLHGNCGHCHADPALSGAAVPVDMVLAQDAADPASGDRVLRALLDATSRYAPLGRAARMPVVVSGDAQASVLPLRMRSRNPQVQMPPLGTAIPDAEGLALVERWIDEVLPPRPEPQQ
jgi:hypothetical protein